MHTWNDRSQNERRELLYELYRTHMLDVIDTEGNWHGKGPTANFREKLWHCIPLLDSGGQHADMANRIIESIPVSKCHFSPMTCMQILFKYEDRLSEQSKGKLELYVKDSLGWAAEDSIHFTMYNDNFAAMAAFTLLTAGERFGDSSAFQAGLKKLYQLKEVLTRVGTIMEFGSPTYTPITTHVIAEMVNYVRDDDARCLAQQCEERMWAEIATHFHAPTSTLAGPYSRAYLIDSVGHVHLTNAFLYLVFGESVFINPVTNLFPPNEQQVIHIGTDTLMYPNIAWLVCGNCHCPDDLANLLLNKPYPYNVTTTSECLPGVEYLYRDSASEYPAWTGPNTTYMTEDYAMGTAYGQFFDGAISDSFHIVYRTNSPAIRQEDMRTVFSRYLFHDRVPGKGNTYSGHVHGPEMLRDEGRKFGLQHKDCSLVVYKPKPYEAVNTASMKLSILFPCHFGPVEEVWLGDRKLEASSGESKEPVPVYVKDGSVFMCFKPLYLTDHVRNAAVKVEKLDEYLMISFYNYEGDPRTFETKEALLTSNGFVAHIKSNQEMTFEQFVTYAGQGAVEDQTTCQLDSYTRWIRYTRDDVSLNFAFSPISEGVLIRTIDGRPAPNTPFEATGLDARRLPFLE